MQRLQSYVVHLGLIHPLPTLPAEDQLDRTSRLQGGFSWQKGVDPYGVGNRRRTQRGSFREHAFDNSGSGNGDPACALPTGGCR